MKPIPYILAAALCLSSSAVSANPVTYICKTANGIVFTNQKTGAECTVSHVDGSATGQQRRSRQRRSRNGQPERSHRSGSPRNRRHQNPSASGSKQRNQHRRSRQSPPGCETAQPAGCQSRQSACRRDEPQSQNPSCARCIRTCEATNVA